MSAPNEPSGTPPAPPTPVAPPAPKRGVSVAAVIVLIVGVVGVLLGTYFSAEIRGFFAIKPWNKTAPKTFVAQYIEAMKAGDATKVKSLSEGSVQIGDEGGRLTTIKTGGPMAPPRAVAEFIPAGDANQGDVAFRVTGTQAYVVVGVAADAGKTLEFKVSAGKTGWKVSDIRGR